ncbi:MAG: low specificity L-threonine aldolase [Lachnospiraceae bacterium]|nr:low specificity L-threonine aldolase [Lachnospiraceae bacterium]
MEKLYFLSDYMEGAEPHALRALIETNEEHTPGYMTDDYSEQAREKIRAACACPGAAVHFAVGGTQANALCLSALLQSYQGVIAPESGHISIHEAGAIERGGHKVITLPSENGKISAEAIDAYCEAYWADETHDHIVMPGAVYLSQPTECGTLYSLAELQAVRQVCDRQHLQLYVDGARLAYALAANQNDVTLADLAKLCDIFYIGGTKCGALFGEAIVIPDGKRFPHFFSLQKQMGAVLAKGRLLGLQFGALFSPSEEDPSRIVYDVVGRQAIALADNLREACGRIGLPLQYCSPTNQIFVTLKNDKMKALSERVLFEVWAKESADHTTVRFVTGWATKAEDVSALIDLLEN